MTTTQQQAAIERAKRMSELVLEIEEIDKARREVAKDFRERIDGRMKELKDLARDERDGQLRLPESPSTEAGDAIGRRSAAIAIFKKAVANIVVALETEDAELLAKASDDDLMALDTAYADALAVVKDAVEARAAAKFLRCKPLEPLFKVR